ncbi:MAG TPA: LysM domain-containing protein [Gaiellaceae bacterium]
MVEPEQRRAWAARLVAPVAFFAAATVLIVLIETGLNSGSNSTTTPATPTLSTPTGTAPTTTGKAKKKLYRVRRGDTLESIAAKFDTTVDDLLQLNPNVDPLALSPGQKIRVS